MKRHLRRYQKQDNDMNSNTPQVIVRVVGTITLLLGVVHWATDSEALLPWHILLGVIVTIGLGILTYRAQRAGA